MQYIIIVNVESVNYLTYALYNTCKCRKRFLNILYINTFSKRSATAHAMFLGFYLAAHYSILMTNLSLRSLSRLNIVHSLSLLKHSLSRQYHDDNVSVATNDAVRNTQYKCWTRPNNRAPYCLTLAVFIRSAANEVVFHHTASHESFEFSTLIKSNLPTYTRVACQCDRPIKPPKEHGNRIETAIRGCCFGIGRPPRKHRSGRLVLELVFLSFRAVCRAAADSLITTAHITHTQY